MGKERSRGGKAAESPLKILMAARFLPEFDRSLMFIGDTQFSNCLLEESDIYLASRLGLYGYRESYPQKLINTSVAG